MPEKMQLDSHYSQNILIKARRHLEQGGVEIDEEHSDVYLVKGSSAMVAPYRVQVITGPETDTDGELIERDDQLPWLSCSCPNGLARGGRPSCYHTAAVLIMMNDEIDDSEDDEEDDNYLE